jgi:hypothetical protein
MLHCIKNSNNSVRLTLLILPFLFSLTNARLPENYKGKPFVDNLFNEDGPQVIPGKLETGYYDIGGEGVAYHEDDNKNEGYLLNNQHHEDKPIDRICYFRKDESVDISYAKTQWDFGKNRINHSYCLPPNKQLYPGWAHPGEWINYTVYIRTAGTYKIRCLYSIKDCNSSFVINKDSTNAVKFKLPRDVTKDFPGFIYPYHQWAKDSVGRITFTDTGLTLLTLKIGSPEVGTNHGYFEFDLIKPNPPKNNIPAGYNGKPYYDKLVEVDSVKNASGTWQGIHQPIPGLLRPELYDLGGENISFHDSDTKNEGIDFNSKNSCSSESNAYVCSGFRKTDGVDISSTMVGVDFNHANADTPLQGRFYLGWTKKGEWLNYSVNVDKPGMYKVKCMYAGKDNELKFVVNNKDTSTCKLPVHTKGVNNWKRADSIGTVYFADSGYNLLTLLPGDSNSINYFKFYYAGTRTSISNQYVYKTEKGAAIKAITFDNNYHALQFTLPETGDAQLAIINCSGVKIRSMKMSNLTKGSQIRNINTSGLSHGIYLVQLNQNKFISNGKLVITK